MRHNTCTIGVKEYRILYRTRVMYDYTILSLGLDSISLKFLFQNENNIILNENIVEGKPCINKESNSLDLTI